MEKLEEKNRACSVDTHIDATYVRHLSSVIADICRLCQMSAMTDDGNNMGVYRSVFVNVVIWSRIEIDWTIT